MSLPDGELTPLTSDLEGTLFPAAADPKGTHALVIASHEGERGHRETLALVPLAGGPAVRLAPSAEAVRNPAWSPDGEWLVFESSAASFRDLYKVQRDGTGLQRLTDAPHGSFEPTVSPDGSRIAFASSRDGNAEIYVMNADGTGVKRLTDEPRDDVSPAFTADGSQVLWIRQIGASRLLHRVGVDGSHPHVIRHPDSPVVTHNFVLSPDGTHVALAEQTNARTVNVVVVRLSDRAEVAVLGGDGVDEMPAWSPDSQWVVWSAGQKDEAELWVAQRDGAHARQITRRPGAEWLPRWVP
jgi:Tol biopolymer transport system component